MHQVFDCCGGRDGRLQDLPELRRVEMWLAGKQQPQSIPLWGVFGAGHHSLSVSVPGDPTFEEVR
jgi:hypothetical protein